MRIANVGVVLAGALVLNGSVWASTANPLVAPELSKSNLDAPPDKPVHLIVSVAKQRVDVYVGGELITSSPVSTGKKGYATPTGVFSILQKKKFHRSNIYSRAPMPFMQRLTWSGIALHASDQVPDHPASHGCVRLPPDFAKQLFGFTDIGAHVIITDRDVAPTEIRHPNLFQPVALQAAVGTEIALEDWQESRSASISPDLTASDSTAHSKPILAAATGEEKGGAEPRSQSPIRILVTRRTGRELVRDVQTLLKELEFDPGELDGWMGRNTGQAIARFQESEGLQKTGAMSAELVEALYRAADRGKPPTGHLYVRREFSPLFDVPITIAEPEMPLGAHLFTAMDFGDDAAEVRWLAVTLDDGLPDAPPSEVESEPAASPAPIDAEAVLNRVKIPAAVRKRIAEMLTPGSSLAISDDGISRETVPKGSDFVVLTR